MEYFAKSVPNGGSKEEQVTLKQHLDDTVKCAQDFFEKFGHYFTEKEKAIIIEACRVHDLGKANIVFQSKINKELDVIKTQEIPHGFLSAMTTSPEEFKNHIPEADNDDYKALESFAEEFVSKKLEEYNAYLERQDEVFSTEQLEEAMQKVMDTYAGGIGSHYQFNEKQLELAKQKIEQNLSLIHI